MSETWIVICVVGAATIALKSVGPVLLGGRPLPDHVSGVTAARSSTPSKGTSSARPSRPRARRASAAILFFGIRVTSFQ